MHNLHVCFEVTKATTPKQFHELLCLALQEGDSGAVESLVSAILNIAVDHAPTKALPEDAPFSKYHVTAFEVS